MSRSFMKALTVASVLVTGLAMSAPAFADGGGQNPQNSNQHFSLTSMKLSTQSVTLGSSFYVTLTATQINKDNKNGEHHTHALPETLAFNYTINGQTSTVSGTLQSPKSSASNKDKVNRTFTGIYQVNLPTSLSVPSGGATITLNTGVFDMAYGLNPPKGFNAFTSPDTDDPVSNSLEAASLTVLPGGTPAQLPEVPFASALPAALVLGGFGAYLFISRRKAAQR